MKKHAGKKRIKSLQEQLEKSICYFENNYKKMQYLYGDQTGYTFMDNVSYDQMTLSADQIGTDTKYLKEGLEVTIMTHNDTPVAIELPKKIEFAVVSSPMAVKGDTAGGNVTKEVTCDNGLAVAVPIFIKEGDHILINTDTGGYAERVQK